MTYRNFTYEEAKKEIGEGMAKTYLAQGDKDRARFWQDLVITPLENFNDDQWLSLGAQDPDLVYCYQQNKAQ